MPWMTCWFYVAALRHPEPNDEEKDNQPMSLLLGPFADQAHAKRWLEPVKRHVEALTPMPHTSFVVVTIQSPHEIPAPAGLLNHMIEQQQPEHQTASDVPPAIYSLLDRIESSGRSSITEEVRNTVAPLLPRGLDLLISQEHPGGPRKWLFALTQEGGSTLLGTHGPSLAVCFKRLKTQIDEHLASL